MLRKRETEIPGSDWMRRCVLFFVVHMYIYILHHDNQLGSPLGIMPYGFNATCEVK